MFPHSQRTASPYSSSFFVPVLVALLTVVFQIVSPFSSFPAVISPIPDPFFDCSTPYFSLHLGLTAPLSQADPFFLISSPGLSFARLDLATPRLSVLSVLPFLLQRPPFHTARCFIFISTIKQTADLSECEIEALPSIRLTFTPSAYLGFPSLTILTLSTSLRDFPFLTSNNNPGD